LRRDLIRQVDRGLHGGFQAAREDLFADGFGYPATVEPDPHPATRQFRPDIGHDIAVRSRDKADQPVFWLNLPRERAHARSSGRKATSGATGILRSIVFRARQTVATS
jgi:hypothetical protein